MQLKLLKNVVGIARVHAKGAIVTAGKEIKQEVVASLIQKGWAEEVKPDLQSSGAPSEPTKAEYLAEFAKLDAKGLRKTRESIEAALKEDPNRADAKLALEALNEVTASKPK